MKPITKRIHGILCEIGPDENGFIDVFIADNQPLFSQWIVRGALDDQALSIARGVIKLLIQGKAVVHCDPEGRIQVIRDGLDHHRRWQYEQLRNFKGTPAEHQRLARETGEELLRRIENESGGGHHRADWWKK